VWSLPANPKPCTVTQRDGTEITVILRGDENFHYYTDMKGSPLILVDGLFQPTSFEELAQLSAKGTQRAKSRNAVRAKRLAQNKVVKYEGHKHGLVILVDFNDYSFKSVNTPDKFYSLFNEDGYSLDNHIGSVRDYFRDQSYGQLIIDFDVVGPYQLSNKRAYYGTNNSNGDDAKAAEMVIEAVKMANKDVNFQDYDWDGNGEVDQVYVIYAGIGENVPGAPSYTIWPHEFTLYEAQKYSNDGTGIQIIDGVKINTYACSSELVRQNSNKITSIGSAVHEFSHCLGLPDLYDTSQSGVIGMSYWSVMDLGCYCGPEMEGEVPLAYNAYERIVAGWLTPTTLSNPCYVHDFRSIESSPEAYILYNDAHLDEYYLLYNIQNERWNQYAFGHGMLVMHVDYNENAWLENTVNVNSRHPRCTFIPADNYQTESQYGLMGDPYPGYSSNTSLTDTSQPAAKLFNFNQYYNKLMNKPIEDIVENEGFIFFRFMDAVINTNSHDVNKDGITDTGDVLSIYNYIQQKGSKPLSSRTTEDVNKDVTIDTQDVMLVFEYISNL